MKDNLKNDDIKKPFKKDEVKAKEEIVKEVKDIIKYKNILLKFNEKEINLISKYITFSSENIRKISLSSIERAKKLKKKKLIVI